MSNLFRHHTPSTELQQAIDKVTDGHQLSEDWGSIMKICDYVAAHDDRSKEAMKIIRKRLQINPITYGWRSIAFTLTLLEALTKNCGKKFHLQIAHKDFLKEFRGILGPKNNPPMAMQQRILGMIQTWALAFQHDPDLRAVVQFYHECKQHGLVFPLAEPENVIKAAVPSTKTIQQPLQASRSMPSSTTRTFDQRNRSISGETSYNYHQTARQAMSAEQLAKLRSELDVVQTNIQVFGEMLVTLQPSAEDPQDFELLMELNNTCKQMQARVVDLLSQVSVDEITVDLLRYNDQFNDLFQTFNNYMQERNQRFSSYPMANSSIVRTTPSTLQSQISSSMHNADDEPALIKFDDEPVTAFQNMYLNVTTPSVVPKPNAQQSTTSTTTRNQDPDRDVREIEQWLKIQGDESDNDEQSNQEGETTAAFNNFLQKRASTIPDEPISERQIYLNLRDRPEHSGQGTSYL